MQKGMSVEMDQAREKRSRCWGGKGFSSVEKAQLGTRGVCEVQVMGTGNWEGFMLVAQRQELLAPITGVAMAHWNKSNSFPHTV